MKQVEEQQKQSAPAPEKQNKGGNIQKKKNNNKNQERMDYRIKCFKILLDVIRTGRQFLTQKMVRRLRSNSQKLNNDKKKAENSDSEEDLDDAVQSKIKKNEKKTKNRQKNLEKRLNEIKNMTTLQQKLFALHLLQNESEIETDKVDEYFQEHVCEDYKQKIEEIKEESGKSAEDSFVTYYLNTVKGTSKFQKAMEELNKTKGYIRKQLDIAKNKRQKKKEKFLLKQQNKGEAQVQNPPREKKQQQDNENDNEGNVTKKIQKKQKNSKQMKRLESWQNRQKGNQQKPSERTDFKKTGREARQRQKTQKNVEKKLFYTEKAKQDQQKAQNPAPQPELHPSWAARKEQKSKEGNIHVFAGSKKKL